VALVPEMSGTGEERRIPQCPRVMRSRLVVAGYGWRAITCGVGCRLGRDAGAWIR
jgi:hypothetical protein